MPIRVPTLRVYANPWTYIDEHGRPMGVVMVDVNNHVNDRRWVGARLGAEEIEKAQVQVVKGRESETRPARHKLHLEVAPEGEEVPNTAYYRERIKNGELFAGDAQTASVAGLKEFLPVYVAEARARDEAIAQHDGNHGAGDFAAMWNGDPPGQFFRAVAQAAAPSTSKRSQPSTTGKGDS